MTNFLGDEAEVSRLFFLGAHQLEGFAKHGIEGFADRAFFGAAGGEVRHREGSDVEVAVVSGWVLGGGVEEMGVFEGFGKALEG
jgi:hypothetical protein